MSREYHALLQGNTPMITEKTNRPFSGWGALLGIPALLALGVYTFVCFVAEADQFGFNPLLFFGSLGMIFCAFISLFGFMAVAPNDSRVLLLFGEYKGSVKESGFFWVNPFYSKKKLSLRIRNFETGSTTTPETKSELGQVVTASTRTSGKPSKVNDCDGNPIDISAVVVWKVIDTAEALFEVDSYEHYVEVQSEAALRVLASRHPYDSSDSGVSLRGNTIEVCEQLKTDIQERLGKAGVEVIEARISHLAYAQEIAAAMLQRQQAQAVVAARTVIVEGAVGMVEMALDHLKRGNIVDLDDERRATMVSNLLVVLCGNSHAQPVINAGSLQN
jgi:regulator of protease activity HflC (stomatin/prohibitin superfamily)